MRMQKYVFVFALTLALSGTCAVAQAMPPTRYPGGGTGAPAPEPVPAPNDKSQTVNHVAVQKDIQSALQADPSLAGANIAVQVTDTDVVLNGTAPSKDAKNSAGQIAKAHSGGLYVKNRLKVSASGAAKPQ